MFTTGAEHTDWAAHLPALMFAYRSTVNSVTGFSPAELMFGRRLRLPLDLLLDNGEALEEHELNSMEDGWCQFSEHRNGIARWLKDAFKEVSDH